MNDKPPAVSVITPAYNAARFILETIKSVRSQTFTDWEMIIVDDCSTDNTREVVEEEARKDTRVRLVKMHRNSRQAAARNSGIKEARGRYIAFLDSDDLWLPEKLAVQIGFMEKNGYALTYSSYKKINEKGEVISNPLKFPPVVNLRGLLKSNYIGCLTAVYDAGEIGKVYMPDITKREDYALWLKILSMGNKAYLIDRCLALYRIRHGSVSNNKASAAFYQWRIYRDIENLSLIKSVIYFIHYALNGLIKFWGLSERRTEADKMIRIWGRVLDKKILWIAIGDLFIFVSALMAAVLWRFAPSEAMGYATRRLPLFMLFMVIFFMCFTIADLYDLKRDFRRAQHILQVLAACAAAMAISALVFYSLTSYIGRGVFVVSGVLIFLSASLLRSLSTSLSSQKKWQKKVLVVGAGEPGQKLLKTVEEYPNCGMNVVGFVDDDRSRVGDGMVGKPVLGSFSELIGVARRIKADIVVDCMMKEKSGALARNLIRCHYNHITVLDMPSFFEAITGKLPLDHITDEWLLHYATLSDRAVYRKIKRLFDIALSFALLYVSAVPVLIATLLIKLDSKGGLFYRQERVGMNFRKFHIIKFRTMIADAEKDTGAVWAAKNDRRITRVGKYLRKFRIDEIPQLMNVLMGDMSFIGPRPEREIFIRELEKDMPAYGHRLAVKPGITGWAQVMYPYAATKEESREKLRYDLYYIKNMSFFLDALIALKTVRTVLTCGGH